jgi:hypothetical protein
MRKLIIRFTVTLITFTVGFLTFIIGVITATVWVSLRRPSLQPKSPATVAPIVIAANAELRQDEIPDLENTSHLVAHKRRYSNYEYAYSISIPQGLVGLGDPAPFPQHGIGITLSKQPKSYIWLDGSYNALQWQSLDEAIDLHLDWFAEDGVELRVLKREKMFLQKLPAMRLVVRYRSLATNELRVWDIVIAFRSNGGEESGITYTLGLIAPESRYAEDVKTFEKIIKDWRVKQLPRV